MMTRRTLLKLLASSAACAGTSFGQTAPTSFHGFDREDLTIDGQACHLVKPHTALNGNPWLWRTMFFDAFPGVDIAMLNAGFHIAFMDVGDTFGCPDAMHHFDAFYTTLTTEHGLAAKPALEGLSRGGLYAYRWASANPTKVAAIYGDAPVCDMKSWPGGKGTGQGDPKEWAKAIDAYHFTTEQQMIDFTGNPIDTLAPLAAEHIPILHVCGDADSTVPIAENTMIVRERYLKLGGSFALILKHGCDHHPHGLRDPSPIVNFIVAQTTTGPIAKKAAKYAPRPGSVLTLEPAQWRPTAS